MGRYTERPLGVILYDGPSRIDGNRIILIATFSTANEKTGNLIQTWILSADQSPIQAINTGHDESICGSCPLRGYIEKNGEHTTNRARGCYVAVGNAPTAIYGAWKRGKYPKYNKDDHAKWFRNRGLRIGSYGDPAAVPLTTWKPIFRICRKDTQPGYTHQWRSPKFKAWRLYVMASTHSEIELITAAGKGWRSFRTRTADQPVLPGEAICPASKEGGYKHTCESCGACNGAGPKPHMVTIAHGGRSNLPAAIHVIRATN